MPPGAKRPINHKFCNYRLAEPFSIARRTLFHRPRISLPSPGGTPLPPGASCTRIPLLPLYRLADLTLLPGAVSVLMQYWFWSITLRILPSHPSSIHYTPSSGRGTVHLDETLPLSLSTTTLHKIITSQGTHPWMGVILIFPNSNCPYSKTLFQAVPWTQATKLLNTHIRKISSTSQAFLELVNS